VLLLILAIAAAAAAIVWLNRPQPVEVRVSAAGKGEVEQAVANTRAGTVMACRRARLSPGTGGQISMQDIHEGDRVKAGDLLLELWNKDLEAEIALSVAEEQSTQANARAVCLQAEKAQREADRLVRLRQKQSVSEEAVDQAVTAAQSGKADCDSGHAKSRVAARRVEVAKARLERTQLYAPFDGVIAELTGELNEYVTPSPPGIATPPAVDLIDNACFYVAAPIDEVDGPKIKVGQPARMGLDAFGKRRFNGTVRRIGAYVQDYEKQARTIDVEVEFNDPRDIEQLLAGYSADVEIILDVRENVLRIPSEAVLDDKRVFVFNPDDGVLEERVISIGMSNWDHTEVLSGISEGELVVTSVDREGIRDGARARRETDTDQ